MASNRLRAQEPVTYRCALCDSEHNVNWYCNDCQESFCERCKALHTRRKKTKNDDVVAIGKANRQGKKPEPDICKLHSGKLCDLYCSDCNMLLCSICVSKTHKLHNWKNFEDELPSKRQQIKDHIITISAKIAHFKIETSNGLCAVREFNVGIATIQQDVISQRFVLKAEVDSIADEVLAELSSLEKEESAVYEKHRQQSEKTIEELTQLLEQTKSTDTTSMSLFETESSLRITLPLYDVTEKYILPKQPRFITGSIDHGMLTRMVGELQTYEKIDIDSKHVQRLSRFSFAQKHHMLDIRPVDDSHAWLSIYRCKGLIMVSREGVVTEKVKLDFSPLRMAMVGTTDLLATSCPLSTFVYKLSLHNKEVTTFADISPHEARDISINKSGEVFVSTFTPDIVVLNQTGAIVRELTCGLDACILTCFSSGDIAVSDITCVSVITESSGTTKHNWTGELDNGQQVENMSIPSVACDQYGRLFIPDVKNHQVHVLPKDGKEASSLLGKSHGVIGPTAVSVDARGHVWIGCADGTVHVMQL